jgi:CRISPR-associated endonuclease/helicase Cas3
MDRDPRHEHCWAKTTEDGQPGISVREHCLNVGCVAEALVAEAFLVAPPPAAATLAALHDVGKVSPGFQKKCEAWLVCHDLVSRAQIERWGMMESDHAKVSQFTVQGLLGKSRLYPWAAVVGAHHGRIKGDRVVANKDWELERRRLAQELIQEFGPLPSQPPEENEATLWWLAGLITVADWIGSDERHFPQFARWQMEQRREKARSALVAIHWKRSAARQLAHFSDLFPQIAQANSLQSAVLKSVREPGVYTIEGPMGCGKTEAALAAAYQLIAGGKASGLYFALPTQTTSNRIHLRVRSFVERISEEPTAVRLAHSASWLAENEPPTTLRPASPDMQSRDDARAGRSWFASAKRALLAPYGVGTIDQALLGVVAAKHFFVRRFGLAGKIVVLDEIHTYDLYTSTLVDVLVKKLRDLHCTVLILSATLTMARRRELLQAAEGEPLSHAYPLLSASGMPHKEVPCAPPIPKRVTVRFAQPGSLLEEALARAEEGQCVLWIRNTVDDAQETYRNLKSTSRQGGPEIALLHARFPFFQREQLEDGWMERLGKNSPNRPNGCILVSTQVAEQSVDIDADLLVTDLAPTDMLLQRLGRLWRHDRDRPAAWRPEVWIPSFLLSDDELARVPPKDLISALGKSAKVYAPYVLFRTLRQWRGREAITLPADVRTTLEATYSEPDTCEPEAWCQLRADLENRKRTLAEMALSTTNVWSQPALQDDEGVQTRYSSYPTASLLVLRGIETLKTLKVRLHMLDGTQTIAGAWEWDFDAAKSIHRNLVRLPRWAVAAALQSPPDWLTNYVRGEVAVGIVRSDGGIHWPGSVIETGLSYHAEQGVIIGPTAKTRKPREEFDESYD